MIRILSNGFKTDDCQTVQRAWYSIGPLTNYPEGTISVYKPDTGEFSKEIREEFAVLKGEVIHVLPSHPRHAEVKAAHDAAQVKRVRRITTGGKI